MNSGRANHLPSILVTGASGFIGRHLLEASKHHYKIYALSRGITDRSIIPKHPNIEWIDADIGNFFFLHSALSELRIRGGVDYVVHLASFYDFNYDDNPEYIRTNIVGTKHVLEEAVRLHPKRFFFASSLAACDFTRGKIINEDSPADAQFWYARTKREGEELVKSYSQQMPCVIGRFAAGFSDWCEYGPLYVFLNTWLSGGWKSRILGGKGQSAITYLHANCLVNFILNILRRSENLPRIATYIASPTMPVSHLELYNLATKFYFGKTNKPILMPAPIAAMGVWGLDLFGKITGNRPFERPWMIRYIDKRLHVDNTRTRNELDWEPVTRYLIQRRLLYMIERMKSYPYEWHKRNTKMLKAIQVPSNFILYEALDRVRDRVISRTMEFILSEENRNRFSNYHTLDPLIFKKDLTAAYQFLSVSVKSKDRMSMLAYARQLAYVRSRQGFPLEEVQQTIAELGRIIQEELSTISTLRGMDQYIYDEVSLAFQLMLDELEGGYEDAERDLEREMSTYRSTHQYL